MEYELVHTSYAGRLLQTSTRPEEEAMADLVARSRPAYSLPLSTNFKVVCLFCLLGLSLAAALVPMIAPETLIWTLSHI